MNGKEVAKSSELNPTLYSVVGRTDHVEELSNSRVIELKELIAILCNNPDELPRPETVKRDLSEAPPIGYVFTKTDFIIDDLHVMGELIRRIKFMIADNPDAFLQELGEKKSKVHDR